MADTVARARHRAVGSPVRQVLLWFAMLVACGHRATVEQARFAPRITIVLTVPGESAESLEQSVAPVLEHAVITTPQVAHVRTWLEPGRATVEVELEGTAASATALSQIREHIGQVARALPPGALPVISESRDPARVVMRYIVHDTTRPAVEVRSWHDQIIRSALQSIPGVGEVVTCGGRIPHRVIELDPTRMDAAGVAIMTVRDVVAGSATKRAPVALDALASSTVGEPSHPVKLSDIAAVRDEPIESCAAYNEQGAIVLGTVYAQAGADPAVVREALEGALRKLAATTPAGVAVHALPRTPPIRFKVEAPLTRILANLGDDRAIEHVVVEVDRTTMLYVVPFSDADASALEKRLRLEYIRRGVIVQDGRLVQLLGVDRNQLAKLASETGLLLAKSGVLADIRVRNVPVLRPKLDRDGVANAGVSLRDVTDTLSAFSDAGLTIGDVTIRCSQSGWDVRDVIQRARIKLPDGTLKPLWAFASVETVNEDAVLERQDGERAVSLRVGSGEDAIRAALATLVLPPGYRWVVANVAP